MGFEDVLKQAEDVLLQGRKFPKGKSMETTRDLNELQTAIPLVVAAYSLADNTQRDQVFYLARSIDTPAPYQQDYLCQITEPNFCALYELSAIPSEIVVKLKDIAKEGRVQDVLKPTTIEERLERGMLFEWQNQHLAGQLQDPKRGCSASLCTNCAEPSSYCEFNCTNCHKDLIQTHGLPTVEDWSQMDFKQRRHRLSVGYVRMLEAVRKSGDWRGLASPFNKDAPRSVLNEWDYQQRSVNVSTAEPDLPF